MISTALVTTLIGIMALILVIFIILYFIKEKENSELKGRFEHLLKTESEQFKIGKQRDDYVAMMVHELRSPLSVIKGSADLVIREEKALSPDQKFTMLSQIKESASDLLAIVNDILDVSKIESGRFELHKRVGDLNTLLKNETTYYTTLALEKELKVETELDENIKQFEFDDDRIKHVMNNLLSNALKFTPKGESVKISSKLMADGNVQVSVADTGDGIPDPMKEKLFNKYVQVESKRKTEQKGTGLGLFIAKAIIEAHGGGIWIEDTKPYGATFAFTLPTN